jgi:hypothetical protein
MTDKTKTDPSSEKTVIPHKITPPSKPKASQKGCRFHFYNIIMPPKATIKSQWDFGPWHPENLFWTQDKQDKYGIDYFMSDISQAT